VNSLCTAGGGRGRGSLPPPPLLHSWSITHENKTPNIKYRMQKIECRLQNTEYRKQNTENRRQVANLIVKPALADTGI
jgi:hypothetical protein